jgi:septum formation inhibitor MinC
MSDPEHRDDDLKSEFTDLGSNLRALIQGAWQSEQRKQASQEVQRGLTEVGEALSRAASELSQDPATRRLREEVDQLSERVRSGELAEKARADLIEVLQRVNVRLSELVDQLEEGLDHVNDKDPKKG